MRDSSLSTQLYYRCFFSLLIFVICLTYWMFGRNFFRSMFDFQVLNHRICLLNYSDKDSGRLEENAWQKKWIIIKGFWSKLFWLIVSRFPIFRDFLYCEWKRLTQKSFFFNSDWTHVSFTSEKWKPFSNLFTVSLVVESDLNT